MKKRLVLLFIAAVLAAFCGCREKVDIPEPELVKENAYTLFDGTSVSMWHGFIDREIYRLPDGTELLNHTPAVPLENIGAVGKGYRGLSAEAQEKVSEYFKKRGELYSVEIALNTAYRDYLDAVASGRKFETHPLICEETPCGENRYYLCVKTTITGVKTDEFYLGEVGFTDMSVLFDRETGEALSVWSLFKVPEAQAKERLLSYFGDEYDKEILLSLFHAASVCWYGDYFEVMFPAGCIAGAEHNFGAGINASDIADILTEKALDGVKIE